MSVCKFLYIDASLKMMYVCGTISITEWDLRHKWTSRRPKQSSGTSVSEAIYTTFGKSCTNPAFFARNHLENAFWFSASEFWIKPCQFVTRLHHPKVGVTFKTCSRYHCKHTSRKAETSANSLRYHRVNDKRGVLATKFREVMDSLIGLGHCSVLYLVSLCNCVWVWGCRQA